MSPIVSAITLLLWPLLWVKRMLNRQVRLRRRGRRFRLVLEDPDTSARPEAAAPRASATRSAGAHKADVAPAVEEQVNAMQAELRALLAQHSQTRHLMRHLAYIERALRLSGPDALDVMPLEVLQKSLAQFEDLVSDWSSPGLAELRLRLSMLIGDKEEQARSFQPSNSVLSDFMASRQLQVREASASDFDAAAKDWGAAPKTDT